MFHQLPKHKVISISNTFGGEGSWHFTIVQTWRKMACPSADGEFAAGWRTDSCPPIHIWTQKIEAQEPAPIPDPAALGCACPPLGRASHTSHGCAGCLPQRREMKGEGCKHQRNLGDCLIKKTQLIPCKLFRPQALPYPAVGASSRKHSWGCSRREEGAFQSQGPAAARGPWAPQHQRTGDGLDVTSTRLAHFKI